MILLVLIIFACAIVPIKSQQSQDPPPVYQVVINQSLVEAAVIAENAVTEWIPTAQLFVAVNEYMNYAVGNMSLLYKPNVTAAFVNSTRVNGNCPVAPYAQYILNQTLTLEFLCCHIQKLRAPALFTSLARFTAAYLGSFATPGVDTTTLALEYTQQVHDLDVTGLVDAACLDDTTITLPECAIVRAIAATPVAGLLLQAYTDIIVNTITLFTCSQGLSATCAVNGTVTENQVPLPDLDFPDVSYDAVCGWDTLAAFEASRTTTVCAPL